MPSVPTCKSHTSNFQFPIQFQFQFQFPTSNFQLPIQLSNFQLPTSNQSINPTPSSHSIHQFTPFIPLHSIIKFTPSIHSIIHAMQLIPFPIHSHSIPNPIPCIAISNFTSLHSISSSVPGLVRYAPVRLRVRSVHGPVHAPAWTRALAPGLRRTMSTMEQQCTGAMAHAHVHGHCAQRHMAPRAPYADNPRD